MGVKNNLQPEFVDMHCHILPGLDDGAKDLEESLKMVRIAAESGIREMIVTPHYKNGRHNASAKTILSRIETVKQYAMEHGFLVSLYQGNEIFYYNGLRDALVQNEVLTLNETNRVLIEFSPLEQYIYIRNALEEIVSAGYVPILAHVERYQCIVKNVENAIELTRLGVELQINASSVIGKLGRETQKFIFKLLEKRLVTYVSSDAHDSKKRTPDMTKCYKKLKRKLDPQYLDSIMRCNAMMLINV